MRISSVNKHILLLFSLSVSNFVDILLKSNEIRYFRAIASGVPALNVPITIQCPI